MMHESQPLFHYKRHLIKMIKNVIFNTLKKTKNAKQNITFSAAFNTGLLPMYNAPIN